MYSIIARRSIRRYLDRAVPNEKLLEVLNATMNAPSAGDQQPWHFIIINKRDILDKIPEVHPHSNMIKGAPVAILICGDPSLEKHKGFWVQDCSAATENLLIACQALGLGSVWLGVYPREDRVKGLQKLLAIPEHIIPFSLMPIGYPAEYLPPGNRFDEARIKYNKWS